jgi:valyl-tRNA synthetase
MLETGYDIMFFWALRMVGMCHALSGQLPYSQILFHGLVNDSQGRKMSKSIGNVIDPIDLIDGASLKELKERVLKSNLSMHEMSASVKYQDKQYPKGIEAVGCDATRLALLVQDFKSNFLKQFVKHVLI